MRHFSTNCNKHDLAKSRANSYIYAPPPPYYQQGEGIAHHFNLRYRVIQQCVQQSQAFLSLTHVIGGHIYKLQFSQEESKPAKGKSQNYKL